MVRVGTRQARSPLVTLPAMMQTVRTYADKMVQVPQMAESISEGTLKQFSKGVGDFVEQDEELATIETDKIDVAVNAPEAGTIKEILVAEEDTVTVGQDIIRMEPGGAPSGGDKDSGSKKDDTSGKDAKPKETNATETSKPADKSQQTEAPAKENSKPTVEESKPKEQSPTKPKPEEKSSAPPQTAAAPSGREERRVCLHGSQEIRTDSL